MDSRATAALESARDGAAQATVAAATNTTMVAQQVELPTKCDFVMHRPPSRRPPVGKQWDMVLGEFVSCQNQAAPKGAKRKRSNATGIIAASATKKSRATSIGNMPFVEPSSDEDWRLVAVCINKARDGGSNVWNVACDTYNAAVNLALLDGSGASYTGPTTKAKLKSAVEKREDSRRRSNAAAQLESLASSAGKSSAPSAITTGNPTVRQKNHQRRRQENEATAKSVPLGLDAIGEPTPISALAFELNEPFVDLLYSQKLKVGAALSSSVHMHRRCKVQAMALWSEAVEMN